MKETVAALSVAVPAARIVVEPGPATDGTVIVQDPLPVLLTAGPVVVVPLLSVTGIVT